MKNFLLCCDWGTTSFRLRLVNLHDQEVVGEILSAEGAAYVFEMWKAVGSTGLNKQQFFIKHLTGQIARLSAGLDILLHDVGIVISGMASSSIGLYEVAYARLPFDLDGSHVSLHRMDGHQDFPHDILLISGVRSERDVMRGEETQLVGLAHLMDLSGADSIVIFPGTHAKHVYIRNGRLVDFHTYMTGELFRIISNHSILKESIEVSAASDFNPADLQAFRMGVWGASQADLLRGLFSVRTNQLFSKLNKRENALYLSGLLIGSEIKNLLDEIDMQLILCSGHNLYQLYKLATEELKLSNRTITVASDVIDKATVAGQVKIFQNQTLTFNNRTL